jgi:transcriptional regulator with XRE-family HTH domain
MTTKRRKPPRSGAAKDKPDRTDKDIMARKSHFALAPAAEDMPEALAPTQLTKQEFGRRLAHMLDERHMSQSDLVRLIKAHTGADIGRDAISTYVNGRSFPTPKSLGLICAALGVTRDELLPNASIQAINDEHPALELRAASGHPGKAWLRINRMMSFETATEIVKLVNEEDKREFQGKA